MVKVFNKFLRIHIDNSALFCWIVDPGVELFILMIPFGGKSTDNGGESRAEGFEQGVSGLEL